MTADVDPTAVALAVAGVLEDLGIAYVLGGSLASTFHGEPRQTLDVDFAVQLREQDAEALARRLEDEFHVDRAAIQEAIAALRHVNVIHRRSLVKVDLYVRPDSGIYASEIQRAERVRLRSGSRGRARIASAEDTVLQKLRWFQMSDGVPDRQWRDVLGVLKVLGRRRDDAYLDHWAAELGLTELLDRARREAGC